MHQRKTKMHPSKGTNTLIPPKVGWKIIRNRNLLSGGPTFGIDFSIEKFMFSMKNSIIFMKKLIFHENIGFFH